MIDQLSEAEQAALSRQGAVCEERRGKRTYYKLRFRVGGRQRVRYIGCCPEFAEQVRRELLALQQPLRAGRQLKKLVKESRRTLAAARRQLAPVLEEAGYGFHGLAIRRKRRSPAPENK